MHFNRQIPILAVATVILSLLLQKVPSTARQSQPTAPPVTSSSTTVLIAARGCLGAEAARATLRSAERNLKEVRRESRELGRAYEETRNALREVDRHIDRRCR
jgi:hypothetical protein